MRYSYELRLKDEPAEFAGEEIDIECSVCSGEEFDELESDGTSINGIFTAWYNIQCENCGHVMRIETPQYR
jgi:uncharacterized Zn finger protein